MTTKRLIEKLRKDPETSANVVSRVEALMGRFATPDAFFAASKGELLKQWHAMGNERDLGNAFFSAFDRALSIWNSPDEEPDTPPTCRKFTKDDLLLVAQMMEMMSIPALDAVQMGSVLDLRGVVKES